MQVSEVHDQNQAASPKYVALLTLGALGVVYGDIGTSPLYALRESFAVANMEVTEDSVLGVLSLIFWSLVIVVSVKYLLLVMRADNDGEGGILALTSLIMQKAGRSKGRLFLIGVGLFGTALLYGDGMITPAISVLSAVEGLQVAVPAVEPWVLLIASAILLLLFTNQHRGTSTLGNFFGPIMILWFSILALLGFLQILEVPRVLEAINPFVGLSFVVNHPMFAFFALGGIFLVATGSEALYADMGHFGTRPIRLGWFSFVFPALTLNYFGQGALLLNRPDAIENPFYLMAPEWAVVPLVILATMATVIASQALISGAYSLTTQAIQLGYLPRQTVDHTSPLKVGQVYVASINWILMVAAIALVFGFGSSTRLAAAYGVGVATVMVITTVLLSVIMRDHWNWRPWVVFTISAISLSVDLTFFAANITKIPNGGWVPLVIALVGFAIMTTWYTGRKIIRARRQRQLPIERFIASLVEHPQLRVSGTGVYLYPEPGVTPPALLTNLRHHEVLHETVVLVAVVITQHPRVPRARRATTHDMGDGFYQVVLTYGFLDQLDVPEALGNIVDTDFGFDPTDATYFIGKETIMVTDLPSMMKWREHLFSIMYRNAAGADRFFLLPHDRVLEVGVQVPI
jgi:KUP system potassium uptake protein